jgi:hypothetical protein
VAAAPQRLLADPSASNGEDLAELRVRRAGLDVARDVRMFVGDVQVGIHSARLPIRWEDATRPGLFPILEATLEIAPVRAGRHAMTQLGLFGRYARPSAASERWQITWPAIASSSSRSSSSSTTRRTRRHRRHGQPGEQPGRHRLRRRDLQRRSLAPPARNQLKMIWSLGL